MSQGRTTPIWPVNIVILFAFAMSITAPRDWQRSARRTALAPPKSNSARTVAAGEWAVADAGANDTQPRSPLPTWGRPAKPAPRIAAEVAIATPRVETQPAPQPEPVPQPEPTPLLSVLPTLPTPAATPIVAPTITAPIAAPIVAPIAQPIVAPIAQPIVAAPVIEPEVVEEPPTLDRPRLSGGLRIARTTTTTPAPSGAAVAFTPAIPEPIVASPVASPVVAAPLLVLPTLPAPTAVSIAEQGPTLLAPLKQPTLQQPTLTPALAQPTPQPIAPPQIAATMKPAESKPIEVKPIEVKPLAAPTPVVPPTPAPVVKVEEPPSWWPKPVELLARLETLREHDATRDWAARTSSTLEALFRTPDIGDPAAAKRLSDLRRAAADSLRIEEDRLDEPTAVELRLTRYALVRRLDVWESLGAVAKYDEARRDPTASDGLRGLELCLNDIVVQTDAAGETGRQWREFLLIDALAGTCSHGDDDQRKTVARQVLARFAKAAEAEGSHEFLHEGSFAELHGRLERLGESDVDAQALLFGLERFEHGGLPSDAHELAAACELLNESPAEAKRNLAVWLNSHYRNANVRVAFSPELLNRLMPASVKRQQAVNETILGKETRGWGQTRTGLTVRFVPKTDRMSVVLTADGTVNAQTRTFSGPVRLFSASNSAFAAEKEIELTTSGVEVKPAKALTKNNTRLRGVESDFDGMPILDSLVTAIAQNKHAEKKPAAQREAAWKISQQVEKRLDEDLNTYLTKADENLHARLIEPLHRLDISPEIVDLQSSEDRATIRLRSAGRNQLAANTPRPRANPDHLGSVQVHQSAVNNVLDRFELAGRRFTLRELYAYITTTMNLPQTLDLEKLPEEMSIVFGATDPMTVCFDEGRLELRMSIEEMRHGDRSWKNFTIRAPFRPELIDDVSYFVRDGVVRISGSQLGTTQQISLRTVFAKVFPDDLRVRLWPERLADDPRFADLDIAQIELRDGWIGLAIGPRNPSVLVETAPAPAAESHSIGSGLLKALRR